MLQWWWWWCVCECVCVWVCLCHGLLVCVCVCVGARHGITWWRSKSVDCRTNICIGVGWAIPPEHNYYDYSDHHNTAWMASCFQDWGLHLRNFVRTGGVGREPWLVLVKNAALRLSLNEDNIINKSQARLCRMKYFRVNSLQCRYVCLRVCHGLRWCPGSMAAVHASNTVA